MKKPKKSFYIITLDAKRIIKLINSKNIQLDFSPVVSKNGESTKSVDYRSYVKIKEARDDNAMFYQLRRALGIKEEEAVPESLEKHFIYMDCSGIDLSEKNKAECEKVKALIEKGLRINFDTGKSKKDGTHFVAFDKSASMSRQGRISFIDKRLKDEMNDRLTLGIPFDRFVSDKSSKKKAIDSGAKVSLSKYYAYRGLCFSDGERIENIKLSKDNVLILPDKIGGLNMTAKILTAEPKDRAKSDWEKTVIEKMDLKEEKINFFDGEGLICPDYAAIISESLGAFEEKLSTFQIRMPFTKGILHMVNFHQFIREEILEKSGFDELRLEDIVVKDIFDIKRNLSEIKIIMTESMFKCSNWLKYAQDHCGGEFEEDPMDFYFKKFREYDYALYVGNTNAVLRRSGKVALNYQFFNTLKLKDSDFESLLGDYVATIEKYAGEDDTEYNTDNFIPDDERIKSGNGETWTEVLKIRRDLKQERFISERIRSRKKGMLDRIYPGRIDVPGEMRFLSGDLLALLNHLASSCATRDNNSAFESKLKALTAEIKSKYIYPDRFYLPGNKFVKDKKIKDPKTGKYSRPTEKRYFGMLRSPHLSRYEQCALRAYNPGKDELIDKYFRHLGGVVMVSKNGFTAAALGGADFDGDLVKIIFDERINNAILLGCYAHDEESDDKSVYRRDAPYIKIPDKAKNKSKNESKNENKNKKETEVVYPSNLMNIPFRTVRNTFSNQIGQISNAAIKIGGKEYFEKDNNENDNDKTDDDKKNPYEDCCGECTIATGLEIDAAKTGAHPTKYIERLKAIAKAASKNNGSAEYLEMLKKARKYSHGLSGASKESRNLLLENASEAGGALARLFSEYKNALDSDATKADEEKPSEKEKIYLVPESVSANPENKKTISEIVNAYLKIRNHIESFYRSRHRSPEDYDGHILTLAMLHYGDINNPFGETGKTVADVIGDTYAFFWEIICSNNGGKEILKRFRNCNPEWHFTPKDERKEKLSEILGGEIPDENVLKLLTDFSCRGYYYLDYFIKDSKAEYDSNSDPDKWAIKTKFSVNEDRYAKEFYGIFKDGFIQKKTRKDIENGIKTACRKRMREYAGKDYDKDSKCFTPGFMKFVESCDKEHNAFWNLFNKEEILNAVTDSQKTLEVDEYVK